MKYKTNKLISIIIPTYNRGYIIYETLDSILSQTYRNWECIIVDDGSTDNTKDIIDQYIEKDPRFSYHLRPAGKPKGANTCRNYGFGISKGEYIHWLDSDDLYTTNALEEFTERLIYKNDVVVCKVTFVELATGKVIRENKILSQNLIEDYFCGKISFYVSGPIWRKKFLEKQVYLFDDNISNLDDWDFNLRMLYQNPKIEYINKPLILYRIHSQSLTHEIEELNYKEILSEIYAREKHIQLIKNDRKNDVHKLNKFLKDRYKSFFIASMLKKDLNRFFYLKELIKKQFEFNDFYGVVKVIFAFLVYSVIGKGYFLLKKI